MRTDRYFGLASWHGRFGKSGIDLSWEALMVCRIHCKTEIQFTILQALFQLILSREL
jgi:hypothetical protein